MADIGRSIILTMAPLEERGYEEFLTKVGFHREEDQFHRQDKELIKAWLTYEDRRKDLWRKMETKFTQYLDYINTGRRLRIGERTMDQEILQWLPHLSYCAKTKKVPLPRFLKVNACRVYEALVRHGTENLLVVYDHVWEKFNMHMHDFCKALE